MSDPLLGHTTLAFTRTLMELEDLSVSSTPRTHRANWIRTEPETSGNTGFKDLRALADPKQAES
jgi:hypothetical protein